MRALGKFKKGEVQALVATDIAARGIDLTDLSHVVNFDLPHVPEDYIHRIGRTGRAGKSGIAVSLICSEDTKLLRNIERLLKKNIEVVKVPDFVPVKEAQPQRTGQRPPAKSRPHPNANKYSGNKTRSKKML